MTIRVLDFILTPIGVDETLCKVKNSLTFLETREVAKPLSAKTCNFLSLLILEQGHCLKLQSVTLFKMYIISEYTLNPFSKLCFWLVMNHYGTHIISVYIQTILDWFG